MIYLYAFLFCAAACFLAELLYQVTKLTIGHIVCIFVIIGSVLELVGVYKKFHEIFGAGASLPISSFGALLTRGAIEASENYDLLNMLSGIYKYVAAGIGVAVFVAFFCGLVFKPKS